MMDSQRRICRTLLVATALPAAMLAALAVARPAQAVERAFYSGGRPIPLVRSNDELFVMCDTHDGGQAALRLNNLGLGRIEAVPGAYWPHCAILKVPAVTRAVRDAARQVQGVRSVHPVYRFAGASAPVFSTGTAIVQLRTGLDHAERDRMFADYGVRAVRPVDGLANTYVIEPAGDPDEDEVLVSAALSRDDRVVYAQPNFIRIHTTRQQVPLDPYYPMEWHLHNTGQEGATPGADIDAPDAWMLGLGENVLIGQFDDCCDVDHEDLRENYIGVGQDAVSNDDDPRPKLVDNKHGTSVMGLVCASANALGVRGVAPLARFTSSRGLLDPASDEQIAGAFTFARQHAVDVHVNSWGPAIPNAIPDAAVIDGAIKAAFEQGRDPDGPSGPLPARGMVIVFATGNDGVEIMRPYDYALLPQVIGVGASNAADVRSSFSNFGDDINIVAPSGPGSENLQPGGSLPGMVTTDNTDSAGYVDPGYNVNGADALFGLPDLGAQGRYTRYFSGTSAACPVAAGVAAIILSVNPELTATQVRLIMEHTTDEIDQSGAAYNAVTSKSLTYGYGRVNAGKAAQAAEASTTNGNLAWPERPRDVRVNGTRITWVNNVETDKVMVVRSQTNFRWVPTDLAVYTADQPVDSAHPDVIVGTITTGTAYDFPSTSGTTYFGIFAINRITNYSFGVGVDSNGNVTDPGPSDVIGGGDTGGTIPIFNVNPAVTIGALPLFGNSPLTVSFNGNAQTDSPIASVLWDFGDATTSDRATTSHTYTVTNGTTQRFIATFTVTDSDDDGASRSIAIDVTDTSGGASGSTGTEPPSEISVNIVISTPGSVGADVDTGRAPFSADLRVESPNQLSNVTSVFWDLGDGATATSFTVHHVYESEGTYPVTVRVVSQTSPVASLTLTDTRLLTILPALPNTNANRNSPAPLPPSTPRSGGACGIGMLMPLLALAGLALVRRRA